MEKLIMRPILLAAMLCLATAPGARAAGGGGSAGGSGAQNNPANGLPQGEPGPLGAPNNPRLKPAAPGKEPTTTRQEVPQRR